MIKLFIVLSFLAVAIIVLFGVDANYYLKERFIISGFLLLISSVVFISIIFEVMFKISNKTKEKNNDLNDDISNVENLFYETRFKLEKQRKETILNFTIMTVVFLVLLIVNTACVSFKFLPKFLIFFSSLLLFAIVLMKYNDKRRNYTNYYKETIINDLLKQIDNNLRYSSNGDEVNFQRFINAEYKEPKYTKYIITDTITKSNIDELFVLNKTPKDCL